MAGHGGTDREQWRGRYVRNQRGRSQRWRHQHRRVFGATVSLALADGKRTLAGSQDHLVRAQAEEYCRQRRLCSHCRSRRPLKDVRARRLLSVFGTVEVRVPRFMPCGCAVTGRLILKPIAEIMPDRYAPEYERLIAKMGSLLPYRRARTLLSEFPPLADVPAVETTCRRTMRVGARLEKLVVARDNLPRQRPTRELSPRPSTVVTCGRSEVIRFARSK